MHPENLLTKWVSLFRVVNSSYESVVQTPNQSPISGHPCKVLDISGRNLICKFYFFTETGQCRYSILEIDLDCFECQVLSFQYVKKWFYYKKLMYKQLVRKTSILRNDQQSIITSLFGFEQ